VLLRGFVVQIFMRRGATPGMNNCPENRLQRARHFASAWHVATFIRRGAAPGMNNCPENRLQRARHFASAWHVWRLSSTVAPRPA
jgi:hypothetical protein